VVDLLVVEDDPSISAPLVSGLRREGFHVRHVDRGVDALNVGPVDLVLLDLGLPDIDGLEVCRRLRDADDTPIIVVTARSDEVDRVVLLEAGADDYVVKPFGFRELVARIRAVARRAGSIDESPAVQVVGDLEIDVRAHRASLSGRDLDLTPKEFGLLALLGRDPGALFTREQILDEVWDTNWYGPTKTLDVHIAALRKKLRDPTWIETVRGVGFRLDDRR
jgi:DNA-binding response OmpR family regulator